MEGTTAVRERLGILVRLFGHYALPSVSIGWVTYYYKAPSAGGNWILSVVVGVVTTIVVYLSSAMGDRIANGAVVDSALRLAVRSLVRFLRTPPIEDRHAPPLRVTVFVPTRHKGREFLQPTLRCFPSPGDDRIFAFGEVGFGEAPLVHKGDALAGVTWLDNSIRYENFRSMDDFHTVDRLKLWARQWQDLGSGDPQSWPEYERKIRSSWTFPVLDPAEDPPRCLAVIAVESTVAGAFQSLEEWGPPANFESPCLADIRPRWVIVAHVMSVVMVALKRRRFDVLRVLFSKGPPGSAIRAPLSKDAQHDPVTPHGEDNPPGELTPDPTPTGNPQ